MNAILFALIAASCASLSNLFFRKCSSNNSAAYQFLFHYYLVSFICSFLIRPDLILNSWDGNILLIGCGAGILNVIMMTITSRALQHTSAGITFTFQNASSVFPNILLFLLLGSSFGFIVTSHQVVGTVLILIGLFAGLLSNKSAKSNSTKWRRYVFGCCFVQILILCIFQSRFLITGNSASDAADVWFMVGFFGMALIFQTFVLLNQRRLKQKNYIEGQASVATPVNTFLSKGSKIIFGALSGIGNAASTYFLLQATQVATPLERGLIFPLFSIAVIILCNLWGYWLYEERPKVASLALCSLGIFVASISAA